MTGHFCIRYNGYVHRQVVYAIRIDDDRTFGKVEDLLEDAALPLTGSHAAADGNRRNAVEGAGNVGSRFDKSRKESEPGAWLRWDKSPVERR